ncbi:type IV pilus biogenesis/stability protein PilW [Acinetobacter sp. B5B]|uniref:type IV pilus biogenesis/stability protein PilW n=1 Tax=Acinetobacter baretiae TaxID=2605383 RepID=UPI0018C21F22|nr:type IV pilus biogenesis/stability protein PilW [Acinetobacter baretiae]MBF7682315.1 type IV pilus biogenesis/stability protein PilW [Acinetobacter baretiae]MBF7685143.1 type IV pilus biogenesis/stability protein PilW [Acinetobacter baretiae]
MSAVKTLMVSCVAVGCTLLTACQTTSNQLKADPKKSAQVRTQMAAEYLRTGDVDSAKRELDEALKKDTTDPTTYMMMAVLLQQEGSPNNVAKAESYFKKALSLDRTDPQIRNNYGFYLYQIGRFDDARKELLIAASTLGYNQRALAFETLGRTYQKLGDAENAEQSYSSAIKVNPDSSFAYQSLADIAYQKAQYRNALAQYQNYVRVMGMNNQTNVALWLGIRIAHANGDNITQQVLANQLRAKYPDSQEYQNYLQQQYNTEAVWK